MQEGYSPLPLDVSLAALCSDSFDILSQTPYLIYVHISVYCGLKVISSKEECHHSDDRDY